MSLSNHPDLYTVAQSLNLDPKPSKKRMKCPHGRNKNKHPHQYDCAADFEKGLWTCHLCGDSGNTITLAKIGNVDCSSLPNISQPIIEEKPNVKPLNLEVAWPVLSSLTNPAIIEKWVQFRGFPTELEQIISKLPHIAHTGVYTPEGDAGELFKLAKYYKREILLPVFDQNGNIISIKFLWNGQGEPGEFGKAINLQTAKCPQKPSGTPRIFGSLPGAIRNTQDSPLYIVEGAPDFIALKAVLNHHNEKDTVIGADSVHDLPKIAKAIEEKFKDKNRRLEVVIIPHKGDTNRIGEKKALEAAEILFKTGTEVKIASLPEVLGEKADLADCLRDLGIQAVIDTIKEAQKPKELLKYTPIIQRSMDSPREFRKEFPYIIKDCIQKIITKPSEVIAISTTPGVGKSTTTALQIIEKVKKDNSVALYLAPTHRQLEQVEELLQNQDINVIHTRGKKSFRGQCLKADKTQINELLGISSNSICTTCEKGPQNNIEDCCQYYKNLIKAATAEKNTIILMTTDQFYHLHNRTIWIEDAKQSQFIFQNILFVVMDERPEHGFTNERVIGRTKDPVRNKNYDGSMLHRGDWPKPAKELAEILYEITATAPDAEIIKKSKKLKLWYNHKEMQQLQGEELYKLLDIMATKKFGSRKKLEELIGEVKELKPGANKNSWDIVTNLRSLPKWVVDFAHILDEEPHRAAIRRLPSSPKKPNEATIHLFDNYQIHTTINTAQDQHDNTYSILILDAYLEQNITLWKNLLPEQFIHIRDFGIKSDSNKVVVQHVKQNTSRKALSDSEKLKKVVEAAREAIGNSEPVAYTQKKNSHDVQQAFPENTVDYFGRTQGLNDYKGQDILILGEARPNEASIKAKTFAMQAKEPTKKQVKVLADSERMRILREAAYRARPLDAGEEGITITIVSQDTKIPELIYGVDTLYLEEVTQSRLRRAITAIAKIDGWFPALNLLMNDFTKKINDLNKLEIPYISNNLYTELFQLAEKTPENRRKKVFREVAAGLVRIRIPKFGDILVLREMKEKVAAKLRSLATLVLKKPEEAPVAETVNEPPDLEQGGPAEVFNSSSSVGEVYYLVKNDSGIEDDELLNKVFALLSDFADNSLNFKMLFEFT